MYKYEALGETEKDLINEIYVTLHRVMYQVARKITGNQADAEDVVSNAFMKIIRYISKIHQLSDERRRAYCISIVKNEAMNILRKRKVKVSLDELDHMANISDFYVEEWLAKKQEIQTLSQYLKELSAGERKLIQLRLVQDLTFRDIGILMNISTENAKKRYQRILSKLRQKYQRRI